MIPKSTTRVEDSTAPRINARIKKASDRSAARHARAGLSSVDRRLDELDREWDIERALEANAAAASLIGLALGRFAHRRFYVLPAAVAAFLLQHAVQGWCPPLPVLRRLGFRTPREIERERRTLEQMRSRRAPKK